MNRSRRREFDDIRSNAPSNRSQNKSMRSSAVSQTTVSQACFNCVNLILANRKKQDGKREKEKAKAEFRKNYQNLNAITNAEASLRQAMKKEALMYNSRLIEEHDNSKKHEKQQDLKWARQTQTQVQTAESHFKSEAEAEQQRKKQYYNEIRQQYQNQLRKKEQQKRAKLNNPEIQPGLPLYNQDVSQQKMQYKRELQQQMEERSRREREEKLNEQRKQRQLMEQFTKQADKYHADNYQSLKMSKEEVFDGLRNLEISKRTRVKEERNRNHDERMRAIKQQNEMRGQQIRERMLGMQNYVQDLKKQMLEKEQKLRATKLSESHFMEKLPKATEQLLNELEVKKTCQGCHKDYPQEYIGPVPRKAEP